MLAQEDAASAGPGESIANPRPSSKTQATVNLEEGRDLSDVEIAGRAPAKYTESTNEPKTEATVNLEEGDVCDDVEAGGREHDFTTDMRYSNTNTSNIARAGPAAYECKDFVALVQQGELPPSAVEGLAMCMFVIIGCGAACAHGAADPASRLVVAFAFGVGILVLSYACARRSGAQINCAVTCALVYVGALPLKQGLLNVTFQLLGSVLGAMVLSIVFPCDVDMTRSLGTNVIDESYSIASAFLGEFIGTFLLSYTVFETAVNPRSNAGTNSSVAIGVSVFLAHLMLLPIDGCSINPTRSFGPAIVGAMRNCDGGPGFQGVKDLWLMFIAPLLGSVMAASVHSRMHPSKQGTSKDETE